MSRRRLPASVFAFLLASAPAFAEPATSEGAKALGESFAAYFGRSAVDQGVIAVAPQGEDYKVTVDLQRVVDELGAPAGSIKVEPLTFLTSPQQGGTWKVAADAFPSANFHFSTPDGEYGGSLALGGYKFAGVYDPKLAAFLTASNTIDVIDLKWTAKESAVALQEAGYAFDVQSSDAGGGAVNAKLHHALKSLLETVKVTPKATSAGAPAAPVQIVYKAGPMTSDASMEGLRSRSILDLWAFLVGLDGIEHVVDHQDELKSHLTAILPIWNDGKASASLDTLSAQLPFGGFSVKSLQERIAFSGLVPHGELELGIKLDGLVLPTALLPPWSDPLLPNVLDANVKFMVEGLDLVARSAIADLDLKEDPPLSQENQEKLAGLLRDGKPKIVIEPSRITSPSYAISVEGEFEVTGEKPTGHVVVGADGFEKSFAIVQAAAQSNPQLQRVLAGLSIAKGLAKSGADGKLTWEIALGADGAVSVNGQKMGK